MRGKFNISFFIACCVFVYIYIYDLDWKTDSPPQFLRGFKHSSSACYFVSVAFLSFTYVLSVGHALILVVTVASTQRGGSRGSRFVLRWPQPSFDLLQLPVYDLWRDTKASDHQHKSILGSAKGIIGPTLLFMTEAFWDATFPAASFMCGPNYFSIEINGGA